MEYRNELKFEITDYDISRIRYRLMPLMKFDHHHGEEGYTVRSVYFDDIFDSNMSENEAGIGYRTKYRIRMYNGSTDFIHLEKKIKYRGLTKKVGEEISRSECDSLLNDYYDELQHITFCKRKGLMKELYYEMLRRKLRPKCIVEYERFAFVEKTGNIRITFDRNILGSARIDEFYNGTIDGIPIMRKCHHILEIKYDELLPSYILQAIDIGNLHRQSYSKYYSVRKAIR